jgi:hypothetical protein
VFLVLVVLRLTLHIGDFQEDIDCHWLRSLLTCIPTHHSD